MDGILKYLRETDEGDDLKLLRVIDALAELNRRLSLVEATAHSHDGFAQPQEQPFDGEWAHPGSKVTTGTTYTERKEKT